MSQEICKHEGCGRETTRSVSKEGKCIFHCEKDDWFTDANGNQDWSKSQDKVKAFWTAFREEWVDKKTSDFSFFIFPQFTPDTDFIRDSTGAKGRLSFAHSHFLGRADFSSSTFAQFADFTKATFMHEADFNSATFKQEAVFNGAIFKKNARFPGTTFKQTPHFYNAIFTLDANFLKAAFERRPDFRYARFSQNAIFSETSFTQDADFSRATFTEVANFNKATFHDSVEFQDVKFLGNSTFEATSFKGQIRFELCVFDGLASFLDLEALPNPSSFDPPALRLFFHTVTVNSHFRIGSNRVASAPMKRLDIFLCTFKKDSVVIIDNLTIDTFSIKHLVCLSPAIKFGNIQVTKELTINDSTLSGAELNNITLAKSDGKEKWEAAIKIALSSFTKTAFNNVQWGDVKRIRADRDTFRQLKAANEDQKNYLQANEFYMMEMETYRKEIGKDKKWWKFWEWSQEWVDFSFGDLVSRFSNDWVRPIWLLFLMTVPFYFASQLYSQYMGLKSVSAVYDNYIAYTKMIPCNFGMYLKSFAVEINSFLEFMNPLETKYEDHNTPALIWIPYKILSGLIIYQIIISLRRKTRH